MKKSLLIVTVLGFTLFLTVGVNAEQGWTDPESGILNTLNSVYSIDAQNGWAVRQDGTTLKTTTGVVSVTGPGDFDGDGKVWTGDFTLFLAKFGLVQGDPGFDPAFDLDGDGEILTGDFVIFISLFGAQYGLGPTAPSNLQATVDGDKIPLSWNDNSDDEDGFTLQASLSSSFTTLDEFDIGANFTAYELSGAAPSTTYYFRIRAYNAEGTSAFSNTASVTTPSPPSAPVLSVPSTSTGTFTVSMTYDWPWLASNWDRFELEESTSSTSGFQVIAKSPYGQHPSPYEVQLTRAAGIYDYRARVYLGSGPNPGYSPYSPVKSVTVEAQAPVLRIVNDLAHGSDWGLWNQIIWVRIGPTENAVLYDNTYERLCAWDFTCSVERLHSIRPKFLQESSYNYKDFDVSTDAPEYWVFIQTGWWDIDPFNRNCWVKNATKVFCCDGVSVCYKWATFRVNGHNSGMFTVKASQFLPHYGWNGTAFCGSGKKVTSSGFVGSNGSRQSMRNAGKNQSARISLKIAPMDPATRDDSRATSPSAQLRAITVDVCLEGAVELRGYGMRVEYDPEVLEFLGATADNGQGSLLNSRGGTTPLFLVVSGRNKPGEIWIANALAGSETVAGSGLLARLRFRAIGDPFGSLPLSVGSVELFDGELGRNALRAGELASTDLGVVLRSYGLDQNYPNPLNPWTAISYQLPDRVFVSLKVYNALGQLVRTLQEGERPAGRYTVHWDGQDNSGRSVASGIYLYRITAGSFSKTGKMLLIR